MCWLRHMLLCATLFSTNFGPASALENIWYSELLGLPEKTIVSFSVAQVFFPGQEFEGIIMGDWPDSASPPFEIPKQPLASILGVRQNLEWANPFLLRVDPAGYAWLTNGQVSGYNSKLRMGHDPILLSFKEPTCLFGARIAQNGAINRFHPERRKRTSFSFFDLDGRIINKADVLPGEFIGSFGFEKSTGELPFRSVVIESEVEFAIFEVIFQECAISTG